ncbi:MAG: lasso peptide biosynthesis B2 protein [Gaiellales bacterium]
MNRPTAISPPSAAAREAWRRRLPASRKLALAREILVTYPRVRWWLRHKELPAVIAALRAGDRPAEQPNGDQILMGIRLGRVVRRTLGVLPADSRCLVRSLVLTSLLAQRGIDSKLVIGVKAEHSFEAHAWVECAGVPLLPPGEEDYGRLVEL